MDMAVAGLMMAHQVAGKAARDGIFLSQFSASDLPKIMAAAALVAVTGSIVRGSDAGSSQPLASHRDVFCRQQCPSSRRMAAPTISPPLRSLRYLPA
jgi:hypothetical protein